MSKELTLNLSGKQVTVSIEKVDRSDLYGQTISTMLDGRVECTRVQVLMDATILGQKSTAKALMIEGMWVEEQDTKRYTNEGHEMVKEESSFKAAPDANMCFIDNLLDYCIKSVYSLDKEFDTTYDTQFSYTAGYPKTAYLITGADGNGYMLIGEPARCDWVGHKDLSTVDDEEWTEDDISEMFE